MTTFGNGADASKTMQDLLILLNDALTCQKHTRVQDRNSAETILLLSRICEASSTMDINHICDLTSQVSSYLHEVSEFNVPICDEIMAHLYVTKALIYEAYECYIKGSTPKTATRTRVLIGSFHRCIRNQASGKVGTPHYPYSSPYNEPYI